MERLLRWVGIKLLVRSCVHKADDFADDRKAYQLLNRGALFAKLIGQKPGTSFTAPGQRVFTLIGECVHYTIGRATLKTPGSLFRSSGVIQVRGFSWCWYLQLGR